MDRDLIIKFAQALERAAAAVQAAGGPKALARQVGAAVQSAAQQGHPNFPSPPVRAPGGQQKRIGSTARAGGSPPPLRGSLSRAIKSAKATGVAASTNPSGASAAVPPAPPPAQSQPSGAPTLAAATSGLNSAISSGSVEQMLSALFAYDQAKMATDTQQMLASGWSPNVIAQMMAQRKADIEHENFQMLSNISAAKHQSTMNWIGNLRA
jgi:hypothetical protein